MKTSPLSLLFLFSAESPTTKASIGAWVRLNPCHSTESPALIYGITASDHANDKNERSFIRVDRKTSFYLPKNARIRNFLVLGQWKVQVIAVEKEQLLKCS